MEYPAEFELLVERLATQAESSFTSDVDRVLSVSEFLDSINVMVGSYRPIIQGEISQVTERGHNIFFTICDTKDKSRLECYVHASKLANLGARLKAGLEIRISGNPNIYKGNGKFQITVTRINLVGDGELSIALERLKSKLSAAGLFDEDRKRTIKNYPQKIGLITSDSAAAKTDFLRHLLPFGFQIYFVDTRVEGINAEEQVIRALRVLNEGSVSLDVIVLTRGGGSLESLQAFNSEKIARSIAASKIPVISAIGHEQDTTIADYVADFRASTPTDAAKVLSLSWIKAKDKVENFEISLLSNFRKCLAQQKNEIDSIQKTLLHSFGSQLLTTHKRITDIQYNSVRQLNVVIQRTKRIEENYVRNIRTFHRLFLQTSERLGNSVKINRNARTRWFENIHETLNTQEKLLAVSDPFIKLKQGYSIVTNSDGEIIKNYSQVALHEEIKIRLSNGLLTSKITDTQTNE